MVTENLIRVVIVDDHAMLRKGLAAFLLSYPDLQLVGEAANGEEALCEGQIGSAPSSVQGISDRRQYFLQNGLKRQGPGYMATIADDN